jgi:hypothetical protein
VQTNLTLYEVTSTSGPRTKQERGRRRISVVLPKHHQQKRGPGEEGEWGGANNNRTGLTSSVGVLDLVSRLFLRRLDGDRASRAGLKKEDRERGGSGQSAESSIPQQQQRPTSREQTSVLISMISPVEVEVFSEPPPIGWLANM